MKKVLLIEDDVKIARSIEFALREEGYEVLYCQNGVSGLEASRSSRPDIIILDIMLPDKNGFEICRALKSEEQYKSIPIIMLTALGNTRNKLEGFTTGADDYVSKPFNMGELLARVKSHLRMKELYDIVKEEEEQERRKRLAAETRSKTSGEMLARIIEASPVPICVFDKEGYITDVNNAYLDEWTPGIDKATVIGNNLLSCFVDGCYQAFFGAILHGKKPKAELDAFPSSRRERRSYIFQGAPIMSVEKELMGGLFTTTDISERKKAEEELKAAQEYVRGIIDCSLDMIVSVDQNRNIVEFNRAAEETFGYRKAEVIGKRADILYATPEDALKVKKRLSEHGRYSGEVANIKINGDTFPSYLSASMLRNSSGEIMGFMGISRDITQSKKSEEELRRAKETAEKATTLKDKFVSLVAHDLKAPLAFILGSISFLESNFPGITEEDMRRMMEELLKTGNQMVRLIDDLLSLSRIKVGTINPRYTFLDANFLVEKITANFKHLASQKGIRLENKIRERTRIHADEMLINGVFQNLISNAIKFCGEGDSVSIFSPEGEPATVAVADTGVGITPEHMEKLFCFEEQTSTLGTKGEKGNGLGLPLNREIIESHGGELKVESTPGKGSTFYIKLPHVIPKVLIVEGCRNSRSQLKGFLKHENLEIIEKENGKEAIECMGDVLPHLIILALEIPDMDGFQLLWQLKDGNKSEPVPVIVTSACSNLSTRNRVFRSGADDFVVKPLIFEDLMSRVRKIIG